MTFLLGRRIAIGRSGASIRIGGALHVVIVMVINDFCKRKLSGVNPDSQN
jgi:hypothetical protein